MATLISAGEKKNIVKSTLLRFAGDLPKKRRKGRYPATTSRGGKEGKS